MTRYCPNCRAVVPENSINCPQCFTDVPPEGWVSDAEQIRYTPSKEEYRENIEKRHKSHIVVLLFAVIPVFFGILGLGQIYRDRRDTMGWMFLAGGIILDVIIAALIAATFMSGLLAAVLTAVPLILAILLYVITAIASVVDALTGSLIRFGLRR